MVIDAKTALEKGDVTPVLKWVSEDDEPEIRETFAETLKVRALGGDARKLADTRFFETLVRVHRAGEGAPFTGLKPVGTIDPAFAAADQALEEGSVDDLSTEIAESVQERLRQRFAAVLEKKKHSEDSVEAGRAYVAAYVAYAHYVEAIHNLSSPVTPPEHSRMHAPQEMHGH